VPIKNGIAEMHDEICCLVAISMSIRSFCTTPTPEQARPYMVDNGPIASAFRAPFP